jgi:hypothetical protein
MIILVTALLLGLIAFFFIERNPLPAKAQAQGLFSLYFEMDHVRQDSARIFAELMVAAAHPDRVGAEQPVGARPPVSSRAELSSQLKENQRSVEEALAIIDRNKFSDPEVNRRYAEVRAFYTGLFEFEEMLLAELSAAENDAQRFSHLATTLFEGPGWPALLAGDARLMDTLTSLAALHALDFRPSSYEGLFRERLAQLDTPLISDQVNTIVYPFTVNESTSQQVVLSVSFEIKLVDLGDKIKITLEDPRGRIITLDQLAKDDLSSELNRLSFSSRDESIIAIKLFPDDPLVMPIAGDWKMYVTAPVGCYLVIGMIEL